MAPTTPPIPTDKEQPSEQEAEKKEQELSTRPSDDLEAEKKEQELSTPLSDDIQLESNQSSQLASDAPLATQEQEWVSGFKLFPIMTAITLGCLLMLLDTSILVTACDKALCFLFAAKRLT